MGVCVCVRFFWFYLLLDGKSSKNKKQLIAKQFDCDSITPNGLIYWYLYYYDYYTECICVYRNEVQIVEESVWKKNWIRYGTHQFHSFFWWMNIVNVNEERKKKKLMNEWTGETIARSHTINIH